MINDERVLHIDLAQNILQSRLVQIYCSNKFHQHHRQRKSLSLFSLTFPSRAQEIQKKKKLARFRWLAGLRFIEVSINAYLQQDREVFPLSSPSPALPRISFFTPFRARKRRKKKERERERERERDTKKSERSSSAAIKAISHRNAQKNCTFYASSLEEREREKSEKEIARARARNSFLAHLFFVLLWGGVLYLFSCIFVTHISIF